MARFSDKLEVGTLPITPERNPEKHLNSPNRGLIHRGYPYTKHDGLKCAFCQR